MTINSLLVASLLFFTPLRLNAQTATLPFDAFESKLARAGTRAQILDARSEEEYTQNHLKGAVSFSVADQADFARKSQKLDKQAPVFIYSIGNGRSGQLASQLREAGFADVTELPGGLSNWIGLGRPVESTVGPGLSLAEFRSQVQSNKLVLVDFGSRYCGSCKKLAPTVDALEKEHATGLNVIRIEAYDNKALLNELGITSLPTLVLYKSDREVWKKAGVTPKSEVQATIVESL